ncbi:MAG: 5-methyltetrahydropteroyltriglutamate--homocysteine methyltransferase [Halobacteriales archaeon]|nr:5-methyltetrahydropteroyltriglutamate--homocysteine methyltransferase [Halobacteriales archaeon]
MTDYVATTPGLFPLPDWAKEDLGRLKGHQKHDLISGEEGPEITGVYEDARSEVIGLQTDAGLDRPVEGQLRWDDMLAHPLCVHDNVETRGLERYYDNNNFYRDPVVVDDLDFDGDLARDLEAAVSTTENLQAIVPGPYSLFDLATDEHYGDDREFLAALASFLAEEINAFPDVAGTTILEPSLVTTHPDDLDEAAVDAISTVASAATGPVIVQSYWGALAESTHAHLVDAPVEAIGYDFIKAPEENRYLIDEFGTHQAVALGLVDGQNTLVESPETIRDRIEWVTGNVHADFETVYLTSNTELFYLPVNRWTEKLEALGRAASPEEVPA